MLFNTTATVKADALNWTSGKRVPSTPQYGSTISFSAHQCKTPHYKQQFPMKVLIDREASFHGVQS